MSRILLASLVWALVTLLPAPRANGVDVSESLRRHYQLTADLRSVGQEPIPVEMKLEVENLGVKPLEKVELVTYPNRFRRPLPNLNDLNRRRIYPDGVAKGSLEFTAIKTENGELLQASPVDSPDLPPETLWTLTLPKPLDPGKSLRLTIRYQLQIPRKFGSFGYYRNRLTLSGGWYPYVPAYREGEGFRASDYPPLASFDLNLRSATALVVGGKLIRESDRPISVQLKGAREVSLAMGKFGEFPAVSGRGMELKTLCPPGEGDSCRHLREVIIRWLDFVEREPLLSTGDREWAVVQAPIRDALTVVGDRVLFVSDRAFKVIHELGQYHSLAIIQGLFYELFFPGVSQRESAEDFHWVTEALASYWTERFVQAENLRYLDARRLGLVRAFSFLPSIDQVIYAPQFSFVDAYYNLIYPYNPVRDEALLFNHQKPFGRTVYAHLEDEIGVQNASRTAQGYLGSDEAFRKEASAVAGRSLDAEFARWLTPRPRVNYILRDHTVRKEGKVLHHRVEIERQSTAPLLEPVELLVRTRDGKEQNLRWYEEGQRKMFEFQTESPVSLLHVDPRGRLWETYLGDNRSPPRYKAVLTTFLLNYDFNANEPIAVVSAQIRRSEGGPNRYNVSAYRDVSDYGFGLAYTRLFGRLLDRLRLSHGFSIGYNVSSLSEDLALASDGAGSSTVVQVEPSQWITALSATYGTGSQLSLTNPLEGGGASVSATWGSEYLGGDADYYRVGIQGSWIYQIPSPSHMLAVRAVLGASGLDGIPSQIQYALGGLSSMRGLPVDDDRFRGKYLFLTSAEYRHLLLKDIDWNIWILRVRDIQGALFTDGGRVTDTVQERVNAAVYGTSGSTSFGDLFDLTGWSADAGYGIRFLVDYLGVNPGLLRFDVARSLTEGEYGFRYYFGVEQSF